MRRGELFIRARTEDGSWGNVDVLDLDEDSFRAWLLDRLGIGSKLMIPEGNEIELQHRQWSEHKKRVAEDDS